MSLLEKPSFSLAAVDVLGTVPESFVARFDKVVGTPTYDGPPGPFPSVSGSQVLYGGTLTSGNYFGTCTLTIAGAFQRDEEFEVIPVEPSHSTTPWGNVFNSLKWFFTDKKFAHRWLDGDYIATGTIEVKPPAPARFTDPVTIGKGSPGPEGKVHVQVIPAGPYEIVLSIKDLEQRAILSIPTIVRTGKEGTETFTIRDLANVVRNNVIVTATISSRMPCSAPDVVSTFTVNVA